MNLSQLPIDVLENKVLEKMVWLKKIIDFVGDVTIKYGRRLEYKQGSCHTYTKYGLNNVHGFSFMVEGSFTMFGEEGLKIWHQSSSKKDAPKLEVLYLEWWKDDDIRVQICVDEKKWVGPFKRLMKNKNKFFPIPEQKEEQEKQIEKKNQDERLKAIRHKRLLEQASRMKL